MSDLNYNAFDDSEEIKRSEDWYISYSDVVTLLLCFFIIFYSVEKNAGKKSKETGDKESQDFTLVLDKAKGLFLNDGSLSEHILTSKFAKSEIVIGFKNKSFFSSGSFDLNGQGQNLILNIVNKIKALPPKNQIEIAGYTDPTPISKNNKKWWKTNMELSVLRAVTVFKLMVKMGIAKERMTVKGFGSSQTRGKKVSEFHKLRKISIKITPAGTKNDK